MYKKEIVRSRGKRSSSGMRVKMKGGIFDILCNVYIIYKRIIVNYNIAAADVVADADVVAAAAAVVVEIKVDLV